MSTANNKIENKNYEKVNHVASDGDSIYSPEFEDRPGGQVFVSFDKIRDIVKEELDKRFGPSLNNNIENV